VKRGGSCYHGPLIEGRGEEDNIEMGKLLLAVGKHQKITWKGRTDLDISYAEVRKQSFRYLEDNCATPIIGKGRKPPWTKRGIR